MSSRVPKHFDREEREVEFARALAFSDGVFAIAITLLTISIEFPKLTGPDLERAFLNQLDDLAPFVLTYFLSFAVIGLFWLRHHRLCSRIRRLDGRTMVINLVILSFVALMPFSTSIMGQYGELAPAVGLYALNIALAGLAFTWLWWHCATRGLLGEELSRRDLGFELRMRSWIPAGFLLSIPVAFASTTLAEVSWGLVAVAQHWHVKRHERATGFVDDDL